jgi:hypothetical protein
MAEASDDFRAREDRRAEPVSATPHQRPRWVYGLVAIGVGLVLVLLVLHLAGGGFGGHVVGGH